MKMCQFRYLNSTIIIFQVRPPVRLSVRDFYEFFTPSSLNLRAVLDQSQSSLRADLEEFQSNLRAFLAFLEQHILSHTGGAQNTSSCFFWVTSRGDNSKMILLFKFCCGTPPLCLKVRVGVGGGCPQHFSVSPRPFGLIGGLWVQVLGQGLTMFILDWS